MVQSCWTGSFPDVLTGLPASLPVDFLVDLAIPPMWRHGVANPSHQRLQARDFAGGGRRNPSGALVSTRLKRPPSWAQSATRRGGAMTHALMRAARPRATPVADARLRTPSSRRF